MAYSGQRKIAYDAGFNDALFARAKDNPYDITVVGGSHAAYEEGYDDGLLSADPPRGPQGEKGDSGEQGAAGASGSDGATGASGTSVHTGTGVPGAGLGNDGDVYIDADNGDIYDKDLGSWTLQGNVVDVAQTVRTDTDGLDPEKIYRGGAVPGTLTSAAAWRVEEIVIATDGDVTILFADGNDNFDNIWDNRAALSYS